MHGHRTDKPVLFCRSFQQLQQVSNCATDFECEKRQTERKSDLGFLFGLFFLFSIIWVRCKPHHSPVGADGSRKSLPALNMGTESETGSRSSSEAIWKWGFDILCRSRNICVLRPVRMLQRNNNGVVSNFSLRSSFASPAG